MSRGPFTTTWAFSSDPTNGAANLSSDGSSFTSNFSPSVTIPTDARNPRCWVAQFAMFNSIVNISPQLKNNTMYVTDNLGLPQRYPIVVPSGAYTLSYLNQVINTQLVALGVPANFLVFSPNTATSQAIATLGPGMQMNFPAAGLGDVLGFVAGLYPPAALTGATTAFQSQSAATLGHVESLQIRGDIGGGLLRNGTAYSAIVNILINALPPSQIQYNPGGIPMMIPLRPGFAFSTVNWALTDQDGHLVNTGQSSPGVQQYWQFVLGVAWD